MKGFAVYLSMLTLYTFLPKRVECLYPACNSLQTTPVVLFLD